MFTREELSDINRAVLYLLVALKQGRVMTEDEDIERYQKLWETTNDLLEVDHA